MKITNYVVNNIDGTTTDWVSIENPDGGFTSMLKSTYDEQQAQQVEHLTESVTKAK